jgi:S-(hydroxymethyl)glutathione dehydrogenase/alcohol dehydrogenase
MKALVLNALGHGFDFEDVEIASPSGREVLVDVQASGLCHTDLLFATHDIVPTPSVLGTKSRGSWLQWDRRSRRSVSEITSSVL